MASPREGVSPKKRNRYTDQGSLHPGIKKVRKLRARLIAAQKGGVPEEVLEKLRLDLKEAKAAGKEG